MRKQSSFYADSLEMMLDTMCNVLGGIIFITLTLSLMVGANPKSAPDQQETRLITNALEEVVRSNAQVRAEIEMTMQRLQSLPVAFATNHLRLPNETEATRISWEVIARYGKLYPLYVFSKAAREGKAQDTQLLQRQPVPGAGVFLEPRPDLGLSPETAVAEMVQAFRTGGKTNYYFVFWVFEDSFGAFKRARETAVSLGFQYGWDPVEQGTRLKLFEGGDKIPPQN